VPKECHVINTLVDPHMSFGETPSPLECQVYLNDPQNGQKSWNLNYFRRIENVIKVKLSIADEKIGYKIFRPSHRRVKGHELNSFPMLRIFFVFLAETRNCRFKLNCSLIF